VSVLKVKTQDFRKKIQTRVIFQQRPVLHLLLWNGSEGNIGVSMN